MPPEWAPHKATWLVWPHSGNWPGPRLKAVEAVYEQILEALLPQEQVHLLVRDEKERDRVLKGLSQKNIWAKNLVIHPKATRDVWIRDYGPTFLLDPNGRLAWCKWVFNAWGEKYPGLSEDTHVFEDSSLVSAPKFEAGFVLEGGSFEVNGAGLCMTTEQCLLNPNRNPGSNRREMEENLKNYLGVDKVLWLKRGLAGDDTDGHIDDIARFVNENTLVAAFENDPADENYPALKENWEILEGENRSGKLNLVKLPMPGKVEDEGVRLPASSANFYIANGVVLVPVFGHSRDDRAVKILAELFPSRRMVPIACEALVYGLGAIHCVSQQEPLAHS